MINTHVGSVFDELARLEKQDGAAQTELAGSKPTEADTADAKCTPAPEGIVDGQADDDNSGDRVEDDGSSDADDEESISARLPRSRARRVLRRGVIATVTVLMLGALGVSAFAAWELKQSHDTASAGRAAMAVAKDYAVTLTSVDSKDIDGNFAKVVDGATGEFKDMYTRASAQLRQLLIDNKAEAKGTVIDAAIKSATTTKVEVLLFIDQSVTNSVNPSPRVDRNRVVMTMQLIDNRWLASNVDVT